MTTSACTPKDSAEDTAVGLPTLFQQVFRGPLLYGKGETPFARISDNVVDGVCAPVLD
jgi:hypothetical protein